MPLANSVTKDGWVAGRDITLEDGQSWTFPLPRVEYRITPEGPYQEKPLGFRETNLKWGPRFYDLQKKLGEYIERTEGIPDGEPGGFVLTEFYRLLKPVACDMLVRNYDLTPEQMDDLFTYVPNCPVNHAMWLALNEVARGIGGRS